MFKVFIALFVVTMITISCSDNPNKIENAPETLTQADLAQKAEQTALAERERARLAAEAAARIKADAIAQAKAEAEARVEARRLAEKRAQLDQSKYRAVAAIQNAEIIADAQKQAQRDTVNTNKEIAAKKVNAEKLIEDAKTVTKKAETETDLIQEELAPEQIETLIATGTFISNNDLIEGDWKIIAKNDQQYLQFDDTFSSQPRNESEASTDRLQIIFSRQSLDEITTETPANQQDILQLSPLLATSGKQEYLLTELIDLSTYKSLHILNPDDGKIWGSSELR